MLHVEASAPWSSSQWLRPRLLRRHPAVHSGPGARNGRALYRANRGQKRGASCRPVRDPLFLVAERPSRGSRMVSRPIRPVSSKRNPLTPRLAKQARDARPVSRQQQTPNRQCPERPMVAPPAAGATVGLRITLTRWMRRDVRLPAAQPATRPRRAPVPAGYSLCAASCAFLWASMTFSAMCCGTSS